jgi:hypothetical protein
LAQTESVAANRGSHADLSAHRQSIQEQWEKRHVAGDEHVFVFADECRGNDLGIVIGPQAADGSKRSQRVHDAQPGLRCLPSAQLAAVPDHRGLGAIPDGCFRHSRRLLLPATGQRPHVVDIRGHGIPVMQ